MTTLKGLSSLLLKLLETGLTIDDGKERITLAPARGARTGKGVRLFSLQVTPSQAQRGTAIPASALTPTGKVSSRKLTAIIAGFPAGVDRSVLEKRTGLGKRKLGASLQKLKARGLISESHQKFFARAVARPSRAGRRRNRKTCTVGACNRSHYAKGLCNNHYNISRREAHRTTTAEADDRRSSGSYKDAILRSLRDNPRRQVTLFTLASSLNEKWQTLRKDIQELVDEKKVLKTGKLYSIHGLDS